MSLPLVICAGITALVGVPLAVYALVMRMLGYGPDGSRRGDVT